MQCKATAKSTSEQCKNDSIDGKDHCFFHSTDKRRALESISVGLSEEDQKKMMAVLHYAELELLTRTIKRIGVYLAILFGGLLAIFGSSIVFAVLNWRSAIVENVSQRLASDVEIRKKVIEDANANIESAAKLVSESKALAKTIKEEQMNAMASTKPYLKELREMLEQIRNDVKHSVPTAEGKEIRKELGDLRDIVEQLSRNFEKIKGGHE